MAGMAESIRQLLAPDGVFIFEVQYLLDIIDRMLVGTIFHEHLCHHSLKPLAQFLKRHGMEIIDVERVTIQKGSLVGTVQPLGGPRPVAASVHNLLELERERRLDEPETVRGFGKRLAQLREQAQKLVAEWRREGKTVAGYGAARSGPTLIAQLGLEKVIEFVVDDHPQKVHKYTPGHHIKVLPTAELYARMPDYAVILAWIHADKIVANNRKYLEQGGHFVTCCPEVKVIGANEATG
jgi:predicted TPR repeat methyltransferase